MMGLCQLLFPWYVGIVVFAASCLIAAALLDAALTSLFKAAKLYRLLIEFMFLRDEFRAWLEARDAPPSDSEET